MQYEVLIRKLVRIQVITNIVHTRESKQYTLWYITLLVFKDFKYVKSTTTIINNRYTIIERNDQEQIISNYTEIML